MNLDNKQIAELRKYIRDQLKKLWWKRTHKIRHWISAT